MEYIFDNNTSVSDVEALSMIFRLYDILSLEQNSMVSGMNRADAKKCGCLENKEWQKGDALLKIIKSHYRSLLKFVELFYSKEDLKKIQPRYSHIVDKTLVRRNTWKHGNLYTQ